MKNPKEHTFIAKVNTVKLVQDFTEAMATEHGEFSTQEKNLYLAQDKLAIIIGDYFADIVRGITTDDGIISF